MNNPETLFQLGVTDVERLGRALAENFELLAGSSTSTSRSSEAIMRGTVTENAAMNDLGSKKFIRAIFHCGMLGDKQY